MAPRTTVPLAVAIVLLGGLIGGPDALPVPLLVSLLVLMLSGLRRPAMFVFVVGSLLLLPMLGSFGLWDPWETHYGEVAREILARDDWITLWWAQDEWFRSKPVLIFWMEALSWGALGVPFGADSNPAHPEWAIRLPHYLLTMAALMSCYAAMARIFSKRTALLSSLVLATTPYFFLLAHQAITDMPFVATMTVALAMLMLALEESPEQNAQTYRIGKLAVSMQSLVLLGLVLLALPQALYLISRNVTFLVDEGLFSLHVDRFIFGSAGNSEIPGNPAIRTRMPHLPELWYQPFAQGTLWLLGLAALVWMLRKERRNQQLAMFALLFVLFAGVDGQGHSGLRLAGGDRSLLFVCHGTLVTVAFRASTHRCRHPHDRRHGPALVRGDVWSTRPVLHGSPADSRPHQSPGFRCSRRHGQHRLFLVAARLRRVSLDRAYSTGFRGLSELAA